jgi:hypothetical protein
MCYGPFLLRQSDKWCAPAALVAGRDPARKTRYYPLRSTGYERQMQ